MMMWMAMPRAVRMDVLVLMKDNFELAAERIGDAAKRSQAWNMLSAFQPRDHRVGHAQPLGQFDLGLPLLGTQLEKGLRALRGNGLSVVATAWCRVRGHRENLAKVASPLSKNANHG